MSSTMLQIKPENIDTPEKRGVYTITVVGCGSDGITHAHLFSTVGFRVVCADANPGLIALLSRGKTPPVPRWMETEWRKHLRNGTLTCTSDVKKGVSQADVILITVPVKIDHKKNPDHSDLENVAKQIGANIRRGSLVLAATVCGIGVTEDVLRESLQNASGFKVGLDFGFAYSTSPVLPISDETIGFEEKLGRIVAAGDKTSLTAASAILQALMPPQGRIFETEKVRLAEAAAVFGWVWNNVGRSLSNEFASLCEKMAIDYLEVTELMNEIRSPYIPIPMLPDDRTLDKTYLLLDAADNRRVRLRLAETALETEKDLIKHLVSLSQEALRSCGKTIRRAKVSLLGVSRIPNTKDEMLDTTRKIVKMFEARGAKIRLYDPYYATDDMVDMESNLKNSLDATLEGADCIVLLTGHDQFKNINLQKIRLMARMPAVFVDLTGLFEPSKVEKEGLVYRGLGRGVWTR